MATTKGKTNRKAKRVKVKKLKKTTAKKKVSKTTAKKTAKKKITAKKSTEKKIKASRSPTKAKPKAKTKAKTKAKAKAKAKTKAKAKIKNIATKKLSKKPIATKTNMGTNAKPAANETITTSLPKTDSVEPKFEPYQPSNNEEYMNQEQLSHFREILENWKLDLMEEVDQTISEMKEATLLADPNDRATQEETFNLELRTRDRERKLLKKIEEAIEKIEEDDYGYCESCGVEIGIRRLEARPTATLCIDCKTIAEIKEKRA